MSFIFIQFALYSIKSLNFINSIMQRYLHTYNYELIRLAYKYDKINTDHRLKLLL